MGDDLTGRGYYSNLVTRHPAAGRPCGCCGRLTADTVCPSEAKRVWDHCHEHNIIRGPLCLGCSVEKVQLDSVIARANSRRFGSDDATVWIRKIRSQE